ELGWLGGYRLLDVLGQGGMGVVFLAEDLIRRRFALKVMNPHTAHDTGRKRFLREARAVAALPAHDHLPPICNTGQDNGVPDFGLAWAAGDERLTKLTRDGGLVGTPSYMAPEQFGRTFGPRADLFSLGCILYEMTTGRRAFDGEHVLAILAQIANTTPPAPHT